MNYLMKNFWISCKLIPILVLVSCQKTPVTTQAVATYLSDAEIITPTQQLLVDRSSNATPTQLKIEQADSNSTPYPTPEDNLIFTPTIAVLNPIDGNIAVSTSTPTPGPVFIKTQLIATDPLRFHPVSGGYQLVEFFAFWSPTCKSMLPILGELESEYQSWVNFVYLDIDAPGNSIYKFFLTDIIPPYFFLLDGQGNIIHTWQGYVALQDFEQVFSSLLP